MDDKIPSKMPLYEGRGARVIIYDPSLETGGFKPSSDDREIYVRPGSKTFIGIRKSSIERLKYPFKNYCADYGHEEYANMKSQQNCLIQCFKKMTLSKCNCIDPILRDVSGDKPCSLFNLTEICCLSEILKFVSNEGFSCDCPLPCQSVHYDMTVSSMEWPTMWGYRDIYLSKENGRPDILKEGNQEKNDNKRTEQNKEQNINYTDALERYTSVFALYYPKEEDVRECFNSYQKAKHCNHNIKDPWTLELEETRKTTAKIRIYFDTLDNWIYKQEPLYQETEFFSQLGGQMGIWLGLSMVAIFGFIEDVVLLLIFLVKQRNSRKKYVLQESNGTNQIILNYRKHFPKKLLCKPQHNFAYIKTDSVRTVVL